MIPAGLEPAIPGSVGQCLIHWATGPAITMLMKTAIKWKCALTLLLDAGRLEPFALHVRIAASLVAGLRVSTAAADRCRVWAAGPVDVGMGRGFRAPRARILG